jgi:hypothetical protein
MIEALANKGIMMDTNNPAVTDAMIQANCVALGIVNEEDIPTEWRVEAGGFEKNGKYTKLVKFVPINSKRKRDWGLGAGKLLKVLENKERCLEASDLQPFGIPTERIEAIVKNEDKVMEVLTETEMI